MQSNQFFRKRERDSWQADEHIPFWKSSDCPHMSQHVSSCVPGPLSAFLREQQGLFCSQRTTCCKRREVLFRGQWNIYVTEIPTASSGS